MLEAVIFDMDGVIIDSEPIHFQVEKDVLKHFNINILDEELNKFVGMTNPEMWEILKKNYKIPNSVQQLIELQMDITLTTIKNSDEKPIDGILDLLKSLKENNIKIALASSSPKILINAVLSKLEIEEYFNEIISGEEVKKGKPEPDIFIKAVHMLNAHKENCLVIEDSQNGVTAAKSAGMKCIGYINKNSGTQNLSKADLVVDSLTKVTLPMIHNLIK